MSDARLSLVERLEHRLARFLLSLPPEVQLRLSRKRPVEAAGQTLHPELQLLLSMRELLKAPSFSGLPPQKGRVKLRREAIVHHGDRIALRSIRDLTLDTEARPLSARHYAPASEEPRPLLVFLHGGGFVLGDLETHDSACRFICKEADVHVLSVEYRLAPEHPFPAAVDDALAGFRWAVANAKKLGADPSAVAVGGDSAGGNLAAVVSQLTAQNREPQPALQLLIYPAVDRRTERPSLQHFADGYFLTRADIEWFTHHYMGENGAGGDPRASPLRSKHLGGLAPALIITAGCDPLRDEGEAYGELLREAGTRVTVRRFNGLIHGFVNMVGVSPACRAAMSEISALVRAQLEQVRS